jgi:hypothetical protein
MDSTQVLINSLSSANSVEELRNRLIPLLTRVADSGTYKSYVALLTQSGTDAPVATVLKNTIGSISTDYDIEGGYLILNEDTLFTENKTFVICSSVVLGESSATDFKYLYAFPRTENSVGLNLFKIDFGTPDYIPTDGFIIASIEIRVYS